MPCVPREPGPLWAYEEGESQATPHWWQNSPPALVHRVSGEFEETIGSRPCAFCSFLGNAIFSFIY